MKEVVILRGVSGAGKSTFAKLLVSMNKNSHICSADDFFSQDGTYKFDATKLGRAHSWCRTLFENCLKQEVELVIVDNTNTLYSEMKEYRQLAEKAGYRITILTVGSISPEAQEVYVKRNVHRVSAEIIAKQSARFQK